MAGIPKRAEACGYHDPTLVSQMISQGMIGVQYPNAQHVRYSIWSAQQDGSLAMPDKTKSDAKSYQKITSALQRLGEGMDEIKTE
jgi:hypothetical protein